MRRAEFKYHNIISFFQNIGKNLTTLSREIGLKYELEYKIGEGFRVRSLLQSRTEVVFVNAYLDEVALYLFNEGKSAYAYRALGCHSVCTEDGYDAFRFAVWAPNARAVSVVGSFNGWNPEADPMEPCGTTGVWQACIGIAHIGDTYKYAIQTKEGRLIYKADPFAFYSQNRPETASIVWDIGGYEWRDTAHMEARGQYDPHQSPMSIYEVHLGSWRAGLDYEALAFELVNYLVDMGYTHVELMPLCEYPLDDSWGYQITGYYSITARYGTPQQFKALVDACHRAGIGVILDWVPAHFTRDAHGLRRFDGTALYEHPDPRRGEQPQWGTMLFNLERSEVQSFLISNAVFFLKEYHIDALRVDAVSCMLYLDYGRDGDYLPNRFGGNENLAAVDFFTRLSKAVHRECPGALLIAEESTAFPHVSAPVEEGGLGFDFKWNMGWMNDTLSYCKLDSLFRRYHHDKLTFSMCYAFSEHYILPFSHDEVVHMKNSLIGRLPGTYDEMFQQLRLLYMYQYAHPGKKLLFMGGEFGQFAEWDFRASLDWHLLDYPRHAAIREFVKALNRFYRNSPALYARDDGWEGFEWRSVDDSAHSVIAFSRFGPEGELLCCFNFTPVAHRPYSVRLPFAATLTRVMSSLEQPSPGVLSTVPEESGEYRAEIPLGPYEAVYYRLTRRDAAE